MVHDVRSRSAAAKPGSSITRSSPVAMPHRARSARWLARQRRPSPRNGCVCSRCLRLYRIAPAVSLLGKSLARCRRKALPHIDVPGASRGRQWGLGRRASHQRRKALPIPLRLQPSR
jgi:hypothetical protein